ncbi:hypothetical protein BHM03_00033499 [Ensete ventricosum]|nr:hypothetical protein BHM03_00033499 [Ensete ventricosum]
MIKIQENINLFHYTKNNIMTIENRINIKAAAMKQLPGPLRQLPPLPVSVNDELLSGLIPLIGNVRSHLLSIFFEGCQKWIYLVHLDYLIN